MRTTLNIDHDLLEKASKLTGIKEKTSQVRLGLEVLISKEAANRLAQLGGRKATAFASASAIDPQILMLV